MRILQDQRITTSDGITVGADVYLPDGDGPFPTLAERKQLGEWIACGMPQEAP